MQVNGEWLEAPRFYVSLKTTQTIKSANEQAEKA